jgi:hypothetical protein
MWCRAVPVRDSDWNAEDIVVQCGRKPRTPRTSTTVLGVRRATIKFYAGLPGRSFFFFFLPNVIVTPPILDVFFTHCTYQIHPPERTRGNQNGKRPNIFRPRAAGRAPLAGLRPGPCSMAGTLAVSIIPVEACGRRRYPRSSSCGPCRSVLGPSASAGAL